MPAAGCTPNFSSRRVLESYIPYPDKHVYHYHFQWQQQQQQRLYSQFYFVRCPSVIDVVIVFSFFSSHSLALQVYLSSSETLRPVPPPPTTNRIIVIATLVTATMQPHVSNANKGLRVTCLHTNVASPALALYP